MPVTFLATGNVTIAGTLDLSGQSGGAINADVPSQLAADRVLPEPGAGGYVGGLGSLQGVGPQAGAGPGGGPAGLQSSTSENCYGGGSSFSSGYNNGNGVKAGPTYGSYQVVPLYGGSGGGGGWDNTTGQLVGGIGGAGGGAIRIASSTQITVSGTITANGGSYGNATSSEGNAGCPGGPGGGTIHLVAPVITGGGNLTANSGNAQGTTGPANGLIRFSMNTNSFTGDTSPGVIVGPLYLPPPNSSLSQPSLTITSINGVAVPAEAAGSYLIPDVTIASTTAVTVNLAGVNIPIGTVPSLRITAETGADTTIACSALAGSVGASTSTCTATFPYAVSIAGVRATW
jgi:hypothetical protein